MIPYGKQLIDEDDIAAVVRVLRSDYLTTGPEVEAFEAALCEATGSRYAVAVANGTAALHCAYAAVGLGPGKRLVTTPLTFSATAAAALALGASVTFGDVDDETLCLANSGVQGDVTTVVHYAGRLAPLPESGVVIEDASHALGTKGIGKAHLTTLSFHPVKTITTGEGGAVLTNDETLAEKARRFRNHGMVRRNAYTYDIASLGLNYRLSAIHCALGRSQLRKLDHFVKRREEIFQRYNEAFTGLRTPKPVKDTAWHLYTLRVDDRARVIEALDARGVGTQVHYLPLNGMSLYKANPHSTPVAYKACQELISLPLFPAMTDAEVTHVINAVSDVCGA